MQKQFRQTLFALFSQGIPMLLGLVLIPTLIKEMGAERFGFLSVVWSLLGYFGFLDLGISRTITKMVAEQGTLVPKEQNFYFVDVGLTLVRWVSIGGAILGSFIVLINFHHIFTVADELTAELKWAAVVVMLTVPFVVLTSYYRGILDGHFRFSESNWIQTVGGLLLFLTPWLFWKLYPSMEVVALGIFVTRLGLFFFARHLSLQFQPATFRSHTQSFWFESKRLLLHGGWITVGNVLAPIMANLDRLLLTQMIPLAQLTLYSAPMEMISRLWVVPAGVSRIYFPRFAATRSEADLRRHFRSAYAIMSLFLFPVALVGLVWMKPILTVWISDDFAQKSTVIAQIILLGVFVNSFNWITYGYLQSSSKVAWSVYTVFLEVPLFLGFFYWATQEYGLLGSASVWTGRLILDFVLTHAVVAYFKPNLRALFGIIHIFLLAVLLLLFLAKLLAH